MATSMTKNEKVAYLANVLSIAKADGTVSEEEAAVLGSVEDRIEADRDDLENARNLLGRGYYKLRLMRKPQHRMANIEDMVAMALADKELTDGETKPIERLSEILQFSQSDMDMVVKRAEAKLSKLKRAGDQRRQAVPIQAPAPVRAAPRPVPVQAAPVTPPPTPRPARAAQPVQPPKKRRLEATEIQSFDDQYMEAPDLMEAPHSAGVVDHASVHTVPAATSVPRRPERSLFEERRPESAKPERRQKPGPAKPKLPTVEECIKLREASETPDEYCFGAGTGCPNAWGCRLAAMDWTADASWFGIGQFRDDATFVFDRHEIAERLSEQLKEAGAEKCPHLDVDFVNAVLARLPTRASIWGRWRYSDVHPAAPDAKTVRTREYVHGCGMPGTRSVNGLRPVSTRGAVRLVKMAARKTGKTVKADLLEAAPTT